MNILKKWFVKPQWLKSFQENWFPEDSISLKSVLRETFWIETSKPVVRLVITIFISALFLVLVKNAYHQAFMKLQTLKLEQNDLHTEWMQLLIEQGTWGNYDRVYQIATTQMNMGPPTPFATQILVVPSTPDSHLVRLANASLLNKSLFDSEGYFPATLNAASES
ncbi:MAG: cell division protein FtsL [Gammaproteobacteria bacterium]|nr:cell division protein FtsL [Gammaproteobacteria bacterium]